ncbi:MAG: hisA/hisF family protein [Gemmatimonadales bacterium]|nr:hisA/hisF family protein [Gemmatimonadales bacterium]
MQLIPVIDLARGVAVQARAGDRARYRPVESALTPGAAGDPLALAQAYRDIVGARECYVADLDAIQGGAVQQVAWRGLAAGASPCGLWVDAGIGDATRALVVLALGAARVVVGLETLRALDDLEGIVAAARPERVVFSLDLRLGRPVLHPSGLGEGIAPTVVEIAERAVQAGVRTLLVLDVGRVGTGLGVDLALLEELRRRFPSERLLAGGGVGARSDLDRIRETGCDGVLVATALHTGLVCAGDVAALAAPSTAQSIPSTSL